MTDPASPAAVTEERIAEIRRKLPASFDQELAHETDKVLNYVQELRAAYDARGLELARLREERDSALVGMEHFQDEYAVYAGKSCGGHCQAGPCNMCDGTGRTPGKYEMLEEDLTIAKDERDVAIAHELEQRQAALAAEARLAQANEALRNAFPHFANQEDVTPEQIAQIGSEYASMMMDEGPQEITFADQDGTLRKIVYSHGDYEAGIASGWEIPEDADWLVSTPPAQSAGEALDPAGTASRAEPAVTGYPETAAQNLEHIANRTYGEAADEMRRSAALIRAQASALAEARRSALEEAAKLVETIVVSGPEDDEVDHDDYRDLQIAQAIRSLTQDPARDV